MSQLKEDIKPSLPRTEMETHSTLNADQPEPPRDAFRRSAGFQIMFVLYSGLEVGRAIDHLCSAADTMAAALLEENVALKEENERLKQHVRDLDHDLNGTIAECNKHHAEGGY
jgi:hypothetical protein